jgi:hypothetical protein
MKSAVFFGVMAASMLSIQPVVSATSARGAAESTACSASLYHQFDFWIGTWTVTQKGKEAGKNEIRRVLGGCALLESWSGVGGVSGHSLNVYDATRGLWHQTWVDSTGSLLILEGKFADGAMVLEGSSSTREGSAPTRQRITWTPQTDRTVRQLWQSSDDGGQNWKTEFDGIYHRSNYGKNTG